MSGSLQSGLLLKQSFKVHSSVLAGVGGKKEGKEKGLKREANEFLQMEKI